MKTVSERFAECIELLKTKGKINSFRQFSLSIDYLPETLAQIINDRKEPGQEVLKKASEIYDLNLTYLLTGKGSIFNMEDYPRHELRILTVVTDAHNEERIVHVPVPAQAGYVSDLADPVFYSELPTYSLPDFRYSQGTHRSFDVSGKSMEPVLEEGDKVVCSYLEPSQWMQGIKDDQVYVIVTWTDVVVKRVKNLLRQQQALCLQSDNPGYQSYMLAAADIREVWYVRARISAFCHVPYANPLAPAVASLQETVREQQEMIRFLKQTIEKIEKV
ncbi:MAG TPA: S24 family peptidase [Saprospiraceae bacterium]|nr:S24 family peptidase [Saprospiraceae bacterium]HNT18886.1 S24 family peptidase [Saprospiraceae bacterium]